MPRIAYTPKTFTASHREIIDAANLIVDEYAAQGFDLTLRQLYYQFVARDLLPNQQKEYKRLGGIVNDARLAGELDWDAIVDRTRGLRRNSTWESPAEIIDSCAKQFHVDLWRGQSFRPEVWIEKDALVGVISDVCWELDVPYFSCRGYTSQSEMWSAAQRLGDYYRDGRVPVIIHLGDHDPSGIDMSRDIKDRLNMFLRHEGHGDVMFRRVALNRDQIQKYKPPPNPAKLTDARAGSYVKEHGNKSWELDALSPVTMSTLIRSEISFLQDKKKWRARERVREEGRDQLQRCSDNWAAVVAALPARKRKR